MPSGRAEDIRRLWIAMRLSAVSEGRELADIERGYGKIEPGDLQTMQ